MYVHTYCYNVIPSCERFLPSCPGLLPVGAVVTSGHDSDNGSRGVCYAWRDHGRCSHGANCRFEHTNNDKGPKQRS